MQWLVDNKQWLFDGVGGAIVIAILGFFASRIFGSKKDSAPASQKTNISNANTNQVIVHLHAGEIEPKQTLVSLPTEKTSNEVVQTRSETPVPLTRISRVTPKQIREAGERVPALMKKDALEKYHGLTVEWKTTLWSAEPLSSGEVKENDKKLINLVLSIEEDGRSNELASCHVSLVDYKELGFATKGAQIKVIGEIESIGLVFILKNVKLYFG